MANPNPVSAADSKKLAYATATSAPEVPGRRAFFKYRDLGVTDASHGEMRAQVMTAKKGMTEPTGWHYHECDGQFVYVLKGWVDLEFEGGETIHIKPATSGEWIVVVDSYTDDPSHVDRCGPFTLEVSW